MKNDFPVMPLRAMYADKSTEGKDLNKVGSIEPVVITESSTREDLIKAVKAGAIIKDDVIYYLIQLTTDESYSDIDAIFSTLPYDDGIITTLEIYPDSDNSLSIDTFTWKTLPVNEEVQTKLYKHNIEDPNGNYNLIIVNDVSTPAVFTFSNRQFKLDDKEISVYALRDSVNAVYRGTPSDSAVIACLSFSVNNNNILTISYVENGVVGRLELTTSTDWTDFTDTVTEL